MSTQPLAMNVLATPICVFSQRIRSCFEARLRIAPLPARITGRRDDRIRSNARSTILSAGTDRRRRCTASGCAVVSCRAMSSGSSMWVAPGFSVPAKRTALRTTSGMLSALMIWCAHLVTSPNIATTSMTWWDSLCSRSDDPCPVRTSIGARSMLASATPVIRFAAPGPRVPRQTAGSPVRRPCISAMNAAPCSWRQRTNSICVERSSDIMKSAFSSPGTPKTYRMPSFSRQVTNRSDAFT